MFDLVPELMLGFWLVLEIDHGEIIVLACAIQSKTILCQQIYALRILIE